MELLWNVILLVAGFVMLIKGADIFVDGSSSVAKIFRIPSIIVGLTIVSMGTSFPELAVSTSAALTGSNEIALGNVIGSNLFNLLMVLGFTALLSKKAVPVQNSMLKTEFPLNLVVTALLGLFAADLFFRGNLYETGNVFSFGNTEVPIGTIGRIEGLVLLVVFVIYLTYTVLQALKARKGTKNTEDFALSEEEQTLLGKKISPILRAVILIVAGIILIKFGGDFVVDGAKVIASTLGMSETLIGLTIVAMGTSLPELVTSVVAARKGENDLAVGNVIGSSLFNILLILGVSSVIHPISVLTGTVVDLIVLLTVSLGVYIFCWTRKKVTRWEGLVLILIYVLYLSYIIIR